MQSVKTWIHCKWQPGIANHWSLTDNQQVWAVWFLQFPGLKRSDMWTVQQIHPWTSLACLEGLPGESLLSPKRAWQHGLYLQSSIWTKHRTSGTMLFGHTRPKCRCLTVVHSAMFGEKRTEHISYQLSRTVVEGSEFVLGLQPQYSRN